MGLEVGPEVGVEAARRTGENLFLLSSLFLPLPILVKDCLNRMPHLNHSLPLPRIICSCHSEEVPRLP